MNSIDLLKYSRFPLSSDTLDFLQQMAKLTAKLASMGGNSYILEGCAVAGTNAAAGTVVINGEILAFAGGTIETYVIVEETKRGVTAEGQLFEQVYISRVCRFGTGDGQVAWADLRRVPDLFTVAGGLEGMIQAFANHLSNHRVDWSNVDNKPVIPVSPILRTGNKVIGNPANNQKVQIEFPSVGTNAYVVAGSLVGQSTADNWTADNGVMWITRDLQETSFNLLIREVANQTQDLTFRYALIRL
jgi:hypothetical protein